MSVKIIIVGAGIAGLSTALFLERLITAHKLNIVVYESHSPSTKRTGDATFQELSSSSATVGGGLGISPNGMRVLKSLGSEVYERVASGGFRCEKFVFRSARGWKLLESSAGDERKGEGEEFCLSVSRQWVSEALRLEFGEGRVAYRKVVRVVKGDRGAGKKPKVVFEDGEEDEADLVVGADGVRSTVLQALFPNEESVKPKYNGLIGVGGFIPGPVSPTILTTKSMTFTFGPNGFFGYGATSPTQTMWWSTCAAENVPAQRTISASDMKTQLTARHGWWKDPIVHDIVSKAEVTQIYPVWTIANLPHWGEGGCVVIGDAAHALDPTSGQGSSQALEDARCLALLVAKMLRVSAKNPDKVTVDEALDASVKKVYGIRNPRIQKIRARTEKMSGAKKDQNVVEEMVMCTFLWLMGKVPALGKALLGDVNKELYDWDLDSFVEDAVEKYTAEKGV